MARHAPQRRSTTHRSVVVEDARAPLDPRMGEARDMQAPQIELTPVGTVQSTLTDPASAPNQGDERAPDAWLAFEPAVLAALEGCAPETRSWS
jgi:hypothetical protein